MKKITMIGICILLILLFELLSFLSVRSIHVGHFETNYDMTLRTGDTRKKYCPNSYLAHTTCCNSLTLRCVRFPFPCHKYMSERAFETVIVSKWFWEKSV